jgi:hypothetical protein
MSAKPSSLTNMRTMLLTLGALVLITGVVA